MAKETVGVVGAGLMGAEIGLVFALAGHDVLLSDTGEAMDVAIPTFSLDSPHQQGGVH